MENQRSNRTITIKINGTEREFSEDLQENAVEPSAESLHSSHSSEYKESFLEVAAAEQAADESFDWILPNHDDESDEIEEYVIAKKPVEKKRNNILSLKKNLKGKQGSGPIKSILFSIALAILIGTSFGFLVLKLVISEAKVENEVTTIPENTSPTKQTPAGATVPLQLGAFETYIVQGGVFSSMESAKVEEQRFKGQGIPAQIIESNGQAILVVGLADSIENAKAIGGEMKAMGMDVFAKPYSVPEKDLKDLTTVEVGLLEKVGTLYQSLATLSAKGMLAKPVDGTILQELNKFLLTIDKQDIKSIKIEQMRKDLVTSIEKLTAYTQQPQHTLAVEAQQHLLTFIGTYFSL
ncbi:SPOR domain-containing protein [Pseudoneobacillus sp. C159]